MNSSYSMGILSTPNSQQQSLIPCIENGLFYSASSSELPEFIPAPFAPTSDGFEYKGDTSGTAPGEGCIGERIESFVESSDAVGLSSTVEKNLTSISLTAGVWDVCAVVAIQGIIAGTSFNGSISLESATKGTLGDNRVSVGLLNIAASQMLTIPSYRIILSETTTVYLVVESIFTLGLPSSFGRISATRIA